MGGRTGVGGIGIPDRNLHLAQSKPFSRKLFLHTLTKQAASSCITRRLLKLWGVLSPDTCHGMLRRIGLWSRMLTRAEQNYSKLERETLAVVFRVIKVGLFEPDKAVHKYGWANVSADELNPLPVTPWTAYTLSTRRKVRQL